MDDRRYRFLYENSPTATVFFHADGRLEHANAAAHRLVGRPEGSSVEGISFGQFGDPAHLHVARRAFAVAVAGESNEFDAEICRADGRKVAVNISLFPIALDGQTYRIIGFLRDMTALRAAERAVIENQERFRALFEHHPDGVALVDADGCIVNVNHAFVVLTGRPPETLLDRSMTSVFPEDVLGALGHMRELESTIEVDGEQLDVALSMVPVTIDDVHDGTFVITKDVTMANRMQQGLRSLYLVAASGGRTPQAQLQATLELGIDLLRCDAAFVTEIDGEHLQFSFFAGHDVGELLGPQLNARTSFVRHVLEAGSMLAIGDRERPPYANDTRFRSGAWRAYAGVSFDVFGRLGGSIGFLNRRPRPAGFAPEEIELVRLMGALCGAALERARHEARLDEMAYFDALTHLPNRAMLLDRVQQTLYTSKRASRPFAVHYLDLDGFKHVNDSHGHAAGDAALVETAERLRATVRESDTVARIGGDEFVIVQPFATTAEDAMLLGTRLIEAIEQPYSLPGGITVSLSASIGFAMYPHDGETVDALLGAADAALYRAKEAGKHRVMAAG